jgi:hypothetical protein
MPCITGYLARNLCLMDCIVLDYWFSDTILMVDSYLQCGGYMNPKVFLLLDRKDGCWYTHTHNAQRPRSYINYISLPVSTEGYQKFFHISPIAGDVYCRTGTARSCLDCYTTILLFEVTETWKFKILQSWPRTSRLMSVFLSK